MLGSKQAKEYFSGANTGYFLWEKDDPKGRLKSLSGWSQGLWRIISQEQSWALIKKLVTCARLDFRTAVDQWLLCALNSYYYYYFLNRSVNLEILSGFHHYMYGIQYVGYVVCNNLWQSSHRSLKTTGILPDTGIWGALSIPVFGLGD